MTSLGQSFFWFKENGFLYTPAGFVSCTESPPCCGGGSLSSSSSGSSSNTFCEGVCEEDPFTVVATFGGVGQIERFPFDPAFPCLDCANYNSTAYFLSSMGDWEVIPATGDCVKRWTGAGECEDHNILFEITRFNLLGPFSGQVSKGLKIYRGPIFTGIIVAGWGSGFLSYPADCMSTTALTYSGAEDPNNECQFEYDFGPEATCSVYGM